MACEDRQLTEAQREAGYQQGRTGVAQALRPFSGRPTLDNLLDYINRELVPAVRRTRDRVNDIYLPAVDNAPSANPLIYYFSTETGAADPTEGRIRLDASPQDTATTIRISETNARLVDARPWLEVMAGGATTPLGVVTLSDAINPGRFIRFDLNTMTDQGVYWDLGVTVIEASHDDPFVDGGGLVVSFIPGVASTGTTVPPGALTPIAAQSVLGNPTSSVAAPVAIALNDLSVLGRAGVLGTNVGGIDVPSTATFTGESVFLRVASTRLAIQWRPWTLVDMPEIPTSRFVGNVSGATARPAYTSFGDLSSNSITFEFTGETFIREQLDGDVFAAQNDNVTLIQPNVVSDTKLRDSGALSVIGRAANSTGDPADISAVAASDAVLRESGSVLGFGTIATGGLADDSVTNAKLAEMAANTVKANATSSTANPTDFAVSTNTVLGRVASDIVSAQLVNAQITDATIANAKLANMVAASIKGRALGGGTGAPQDLTATQANAITGSADLTLSNAFMLGTSQVVSGAPPHTVTLNAAATRLFFTTGTAGELQTLSGSTAGRLLYVQPVFAALTVKHTSPGTGSIVCPGSVDFVCRVRDGFFLIGDGSNGWLVASPPVGRVFDGDKGDVTVSSSGATWTIDNDVVSDAKLRDSAALSVIGRSANSSGDPADIAAANDAEVLRRSGTTLGFGTVATAGMADDAVTNAKLANMAAATIKGRASGAGTGDPTDLTASQVNTIVGTADLTLSNAFMLGTSQVVSSAPPHTVALNAAATRLFFTTGTPGTLQSVTGATAGRLVAVQPTAAALTVQHTNNGVSSSGICCPGNVDMVCRPRDTFLLLGDGSNGWLVIAAPVGRVFDGDKGDVTVSSSGATWTIDNDVVSDAKLRNSAAVSVIGRSVNSSGDPADIAAAANDRLLARTSDSVAFQQLTDGMVPTNTVGLTKLANILDNRWLGNVSGSTGAVVANDLATFNSTSIIYESTGKTFIRQALSGDVVALQNNNATTIQPNVVSDTKLRDSAALSVIGRSANSTGDPADIAAGTDGHALRRSGTTLGFGTIATAGIGDAQVTLAKEADLAQSRIVGRAEGAGTGVPTALTPTQVVSIIDGEAVTWTGSHTFNGTNFTVTAGADVTITASGGTTTLAATTLVQITSPTRLASSTSLDSVGTTAATAANDLAINSVNVVRFTGGMDPLTGMVPVVDGQTVLLVNAHASTDMGVHIESINSSAANRFAGTGTSRTIRPGEMALAWYDGASDRWRLLCRDEVDL